MALPTFICVGTEKGGTTPLAFILNQHPDIFIPPQKETHYFTRFYGREDLIFYETRYFQAHRSQRVVGELTPDYMRHPEVPQRIRDAGLANVKLIFCLRDPVARAFSHYHQCVRILIESESFESAIGLEKARMAMDPFNGLRRSYIGAGVYTPQIRRFLEFFPRENMFFMILETDFQSERDKTIASLLGFLDVQGEANLNLDVPRSSYPLPTVRFIGKGKKLVVHSPRDKAELGEGAIFFKTGNPGSDRVIAQPSPRATEFFRKLASNLTRELPQELAQGLYSTHYRDDISHLEDLLGRDLTHWRR